MLLLEWVSSEEARMHVCSSLCFAHESPSVFQIQRIALHEDSPGSLLHLFRISSHFYDHLTKETKNSHIFFFFNLWLSHQVSAPRCIHLLAEEKKEAFISCLSSSRWLCFEKNSENMLISLRNGPVTAPSINRARTSTGMYQVHAFLGSIKSKSEPLTLLLLVDHPILHPGLL